MSPHLRQHVAVGSLGADISRPQPIEEDPLVSAGWKLEALNTASNAIQDAHLRLKLEIDKEELYWRSVLDISASGEVLFKMRKGDARGLGIKYGFGDAGSEYNDKGIATIKRRHDGSMAFYTGSRARTKAVQVTVFSVINGLPNRLGSSRLVRLEQEDLVADVIKNARNLLFEEELFYELAKEARLLTSHKVVISDGKIIINLPDEIIEIAYVEDTQDRIPEPPQLSYRADLIGSALHLLLCYSHRRNLQKRRKPPVPFNSKIKTPISTLFILRPLLAHIQHQKVLRRTSRCLDLLIQGIAGAEIDLQPAQSPSPPSYLGRLTVPPASIYNVKLGNNVELHVTTTSPLQPHIYLYEAAALNVKGDDRTILSKASFYELSEFENWVRWILNTKLGG